MSAVLASASASVLQFQPLIITTAIMTVIMGHLLTDIGATMVPIGIRVATTFGTTTRVTISAMMAPVATRTSMVAVVTANIDETIEARWQNAAGLLILEH
jgi:hypothetical protein